MRDRPKILLASDMTARGDRPFDRAVMLAQEWNGTVELLHVVHPAEPGARSLSSEEVTARVRAQLPKVTVPLRVIVRLGEAPDVIADMAAEIDADLIVVGAARFNDLHDLFLGTAVDHLVRRASAPVLVVKTRPVRSYGNVLVATDFSDCARHATVVAAGMLPLARMTVLHAYSTPFPSRVDPEQMRPFSLNAAQEDMSAFLAAQDLAPFRGRLQPRLEEGGVVAVVNRSVREWGINLLVLGTRGRNPMIQALIGDKAADMLNSAPCDVLMIRELS